MQVICNTFYWCMDNKDKNSCILKYWQAYHLHEVDAPIITISNILHIRLHQIKYPQIPDRIIFNVERICSISPNIYPHPHITLGENVLLIFVYSSLNTFQDMNYPLLNTCIFQDYLQIEHFSPPQNLE